METQHMRSKTVFPQFYKLENQDLLWLPLFFHTAWTSAFKLYSSGIVLQVFWRTFRVLVFGSLLFSVDMIPHWFINVEVQSMVETSTVCFTFQVLWQVIVILRNEAFVNQMLSVLFCMVDQNHMYSLPSVLTKIPNTTGLNEAKNHDKASTVSYRWSWKAYRKTWRAVVLDHGKKKKYRNVWSIGVKYEEMRPDNNFFSHYCTRKILLL